MNTKTVTIQTKPIFEPLPASVNAKTTAVPYEILSFNDWINHIHTLLTSKNYQQ